MKREVMTFRGRFGFLSNMHPAAFEWDGRTYRNSEAAFQSAKSLDPAVRDRFSEMTGFVAKREGKKVQLRRDWERVKDEIMMEIVRAKFSQNPDLLKKLIGTGDMELVEGNAWHDTYWGVDAATGEGENHLGIILMCVRAELGGTEYADALVRQRMEKEEALHEKRREIGEAVRAVKEQLEALDEVDLTGVECDTKAFGAVTISRHEGNLVAFEARGTEKKFSLPGCIERGFLILRDEAVSRCILTRYAYLEKLSALEKELEELNRK